MVAFRLRGKARSRWAKAASTSAAVRGFLAHTRVRIAEAEDKARADADDSQDDIVDEPMVSQYTLNPRAGKE